MLTDCCSSCPGGWSQTILEMLELWLHVSAVVRQVGCTAKFSETPLENGLDVLLTFRCQGFFQTSVQNFNKASQHIKTNFAVLGVQFATSVLFKFQNKTDRKPVSIWV